MKAPLRVILAAAGIASLSLAGCLSTPGAESAAPASLVAPGERSAERFGALPGESLFVEASSDGAPLHVRLFRPDAATDAGWKSPVILVMSPYFGHDAREDPADPASRPTYFRYQWLLDWFVPRGYAVAFADVRGTGDSGGCLEQTATLQTQDGFDLVEWLGTEDWSNGKVGMFGKSYDAETQQGTATLAPPHLATIVPVSSVSGQYEYSFYDGVPFTLQSIASNAGYFATDGFEPPTTAEGLAAYPTRFGCVGEVMVAGADRSGTWSDFWDAREIRKHAANVTASVLYVHGLQDWNVKPVAIRDWFSELPGEKRAILGQWAHDYPEENRFQSDWSRADWRDTVHAWYDHFLLGIENGVLDALPPVQVQDDAGAWRREDTFPPTDATPLALHLAGDWKLSTEVPVSDSIAFKEDVGAFTEQMAGVRAPVPSGSLAGQVVFDSEPFAKDARVSGWPTLDVTLALDRDDAHFAATLYEVSPSGEASWFNRAYLSAQHRESLAAPSPVPVGEPTLYRLRFFPADTLIEAGNVVRLVLSGGDDWVEPAGNGFTATVSLGEGASVLTLPVIERDLAVVGLPVAFGDPVSS